jgi:hypothetical protein
MAAAYATEKLSESRLAVTGGGAPYYWSGILGRFKNHMATTVSTTKIIVNRMVKNRICLSCAENVRLLLIPF